ncbi:MAG: branched-chain amino acid transport system ATP-binding protein, partial [Acidimicrobiaceae bacterium]
MSAPVLELDGIDAGYGAFRALFGVTFSVPSGGVCALLGPNGAGKTTVARVASGLVRPTNGRLRLRGDDVTGQPAWKLARA